MERNYATQMDAARRGIVTPELKKVAEKEYMAVEDLMPLVASGKVAIPANKLHTCIDPEGIGSMLRTKINVNLGVSKDCKDYDVEMQKVLSAVNMGAEAIMDLSSHGNTQPFRRKLTSECPAMIGTVPVYDSVIHYQRDLDTLTAKDFIDVIRLHAEDGVDVAELEALILGLDAVFDHALAEGAHGGHGIVEDLITEVAGAAVQSGHLGEQLGGLQTLLGAHAGGAAGGGDHDDVRQLLADSVHDDLEAIAVLGGGTVVLADMDVQDGGAGLVGGLGLADHLLHGVGDSGAVFLGDLCAAYGCGNDEFFHHSHFLS